MRSLLLLPAAALLFTVFGPAHPAPARAPLALHSGRYADGRALEIVGDLTAARTVVVLVPGMDTTAANFDRGLGGVQRRAPAWQARQLYAETTAAGGATTAVGGTTAAGGTTTAAGGGAGGVAVVAWLGYRPPAGIG